jgi:hypothetical protein
MSFRSSASRPKIPPQASAASSASAAGPSRSYASVAAAAAAPIQTLAPHHRPDAAVPEFDMSSGPPRRPKRTPENTTHATKVSSVKLERGTLPSGLYAVVSKYKARPVEEDGNIVYDTVGGEKRIRYVIENGEFAYDLAVQTVVKFSLQQKSKDLYPLGVMPDSDRIDPTKWSGTICRSQMDWVRVGVTDRATHEIKGWNKDDLKVARSLGIELDVDNPHMLVDAFENSKGAGKETQFKEALNMAYMHTVSFVFGYLTQDVPAKKNLAYLGSVHLLGSNSNIDKMSISFDLGPGSDLYNVKDNNKAKLGPASENIVKADPEADITDARGLPTKIPVEWHQTFGSRWWDPETMEVTATPCSYVAGHTGAMD